MVKKMVVADTSAVIVNTVYADAANFSNGLVLLAAAAYSMQIYFNFSAYSDMAIGTAQALGFSVMENFDAPYLVASVKDFWKKWHISLTSWLREYIYFPLGGSRCKKWRTYFNVMVVFAVSGLWHEIHLQNRRSRAGLHHYGHRLQSQADEGRRDRRGRFRRG